MQSSNFAAEYGTGGMSVSAVTKAGTSEFHGTLYDYVRDHKFAANDRSNSMPVSRSRRAASNIRRQHRRSDHHPGLRLQQERTSCSSSPASKCSGSRWTAARAFGVVPTLRQRTGDLSEFLGRTAQNLGQHRSGRPVAASRRTASPVAGHARRAARRQCRAHTARRSVGYLTNLYPAPNYVDPNNRFNYVLSVLEPTNRLEMKTRFDWNVTNNTKAYVRLALESEEVEGARGVWWGASEVALPSPNLGTNKGRSYLGQRRHGVEPDDDQRGAGDVQPAEAGQHLQGPGDDDAWPPTASTSIGIVRRATSPYIPGVIPNWGGGVEQHVERGQRHVCAQRRAAVLGQAHQDRRRARPEVRRLGRAAAEAAELPEQRGRLADLRAGLDAGHHGQHGRRHPRRPSRRSSSRARAVAGRRVPVLELRRVRAGLVEAPLEPDVRVRRPRRLLDEQPRAQRPRRLLRSQRLRPEQGAVPRPGHVPGAERRLLRRSKGWRRRASSTTAGRSRCRASTWRGTSTAQGNNVLRGGYGMFFNRNMGNVEYDTTLRLPPTLYSVNADV